MSALSRCPTPNAATGSMKRLCENVIIQCPLPIPHQSNLMDHTVAEGKPSLLQMGKWGEEHMITGYMIQIRCNIISIRGAQTRIHMYPQKKMASTRMMCTSQQDLPPPSPYLRSWHANHSHYRHRHTSCQGVLVTDTFTTFTFKTETTEPNHDDTILLAIPSLTSQLSAKRAIPTSSQGWK